MDINNMSTHYYVAYKRKAKKNCKLNGTSKIKRRREKERQ